ncbi:MAG: PfkB family carbohydrate kinase [Propionibacteriaceae bacterium]|nr:PfkB family carbohydrate kinase [Propionibacteriaceae bacterium]
MMRLIHTAQALVDDLVDVPYLPRRGGNTVATSHAFYAGGAVTVLAAAAHSGACCVHAGSVGTGPYGQLIRDALTAAGVTISSPPVTDMDTGVCLVFVEPTAERTFVTIQGAERQISVASLASSQPQPGDYVAISGYTLQGPTGPILLAWLATLPAGVHMVLDPGAAFAELDEPTRAETLTRTTIWTSNAEEAAALTGGTDMATAAALVAQHLCPNALTIVRDGPKGCAVHCQGNTTVVPGFAQTPLDTNGAGDTHTGVLLAELLAGTDLVDAARRANVAGALKVTRHGLCAPPTRQEIDLFLADQDAGN